MWLSTTPFEIRALLIIGDKLQRLNLTDSGDTAETDMRGVLLPVVPHSRFLYALGAVNLLHVSLMASIAKLCERSQLGHEQENFTDQKIAIFLEASIRRLIRTCLTT